MSNEIMGPLGSESEKDTIPYGTPDEDDRGTLCDGTQSLGIEYNYVPDWRAPHVIREYHQNGYVAIEESHVSQLDVSPNTGQKQEGRHQTGLPIKQ